MTISTDIAGTQLSLEGSEQGQRVRVLVPLPIGTRTGGLYDYRVEGSGDDLPPGTYVEVPVGKRLMPSVVWDAPPEEGQPLALEKLKPVERILPVPPMPETQRRFVDWMAAYYAAPAGAVLKMCLSSPAALEPPPLIDAFLPADALPEGLKMTPARARIFAAFAETGGRSGPPRTLRDLTEAAGVSDGVVRGLIEAEALVRRPIQPVSYRAPAPDPGRIGIGLTSDQQAAADALRIAVNAGAFGVTLIDGVTGSGKTEVYFEAIAAALRAGRQSLILLPEIALSHQWLERFAARFGVEPAVWHSDVTLGKRRAVWRGVAEGRVPVVVGARSALFLPFTDLGLIVVDEEHDASYKQDDRVAYNARDMAVVRGQFEQAPVVLASATPSLETRMNVEAGKYAAIELPSRAGLATLPEVSIIDLRDERPAAGHWLAPTLVEALDETLKAGEQALLFLNRRGYAPLTLCQACGHRWRCPNCTAWLVEHRYTARLNCHHCGYSAPTPDHCPACGETDSIIAVGPGVERIAEEVRRLHPAARIAIVTSDTIGGPEAAAELMSAIENRAVDIVIGTQVLAKGHNFPLLTLVGIIDADIGLSGGDLRAPERAYQLLQQVAGRAGRGHRPGRVLVQTRAPESPPLQALADGERDRFMEALAAERAAFAMPPYGRLAALILSDTDQARLDKTARDLARVAPEDDRLLVLGPAPAALAMLRGRHRMRFLLKAPRGFPMAQVISSWLGSAKLPSTLRLQIDIDPYSFL